MRLISRFFSDDERLLYLRVLVCVALGAALGNAGASRFLQAGVWQHALLSPTGELTLSSLISVFWFPVLLVLSCLCFGQGLCCLLFFCKGFVSAYFLCLCSASGLGHGVRTLSVLLCHGLLLLPLQMYTAHRLLHRSAVAGRSGTGLIWANAGACLVCLLLYDYYAC